MTITILPESSYLTSHEIINGGAMGVTRKASIEWDNAFFTFLLISIDSIQPTAVGFLNTDNLL